MSTPRRKFWGWSYEGDVLLPAEIAWLERGLAARFGISQFEVVPAPTVAEIDLRPSRLSIPSSLEHLCTREPYERLLHSYGSSLPDSLRAFARDFSHPPDVVAYPRTASDVVALLDWCTGVNAVVIPFGGGTSVVGGVEPPSEADAVVTVDLRQMNRVLAIDPASQAALIQAGARGPELEEQLRPAGLTLRFFPQSFLFSTLGGWIATRAGGHFATLQTHIDDLVESLQAVTPTGVMETRRLPASGAGPDPNRLWLGSEGIFGIITQAWVRVRPRPTFRASAAVSFPDMVRAAEAVRAIAQAGLYPANCRLLDPLEAQLNGAGDGSQAILVLAFESADHPLDAWLRRALELCADYAGLPAPEAGQHESHRSGAAGAWRERFLRMPWAREALTARGILSDTVETAIPWEHFAHLYTSVKEATAEAIVRATGRPGMVSCRFTHVYPDGPVAYFTFQAPGDRAALLEQFWAIKRAAADAILQAGGTITHHHAVGRDHRPWYDQERPAQFAVTLRAVKRALDPGGLLNPGVLIDP